MGAWRLAVRVAAVASVVGAALGAALYRFAGVDPVVIVGLLGVAGTVIGWRLPPAAPARVARRSLRATMPLV